MFIRNKKRLRGHGEKKEWHYDFLFLYAIILSLYDKMILLIIIIVAPLASDLLFIPRIFIRTSYAQTIRDRRSYTVISWSVQPLSSYTARARQATTAPVIPPARISAC